MINPVQDRVIIKPIKLEEKTASGLVITSSVDKKNELEQGQVVAVGPGKTTSGGQLLTPQVSTGDTVAYQKGTGIKTKIDNEEYLVLAEHQILAVISE
jgi:chaperonin GroES